MISRSRRPSTPDPRSRSPRDLPGDLEAKRDALAAVLATAAGVEPSAVALTFEAGGASADIAVPAEDAEATQAIFSSVGLFAGAKNKPLQPWPWRFWKAAVQPVLPDGWFLMEQLHGRSYYYHKSGASQFDKPTARVPDEEPEERLRAWATGDRAYDNYW